MKLFATLMFIPAISFAGFDGAQAPGGASTQGAPMASQDGGLSVGKGKPTSTTPKGSGGQQKGKK